MAMKYTQENLSNIASQLTSADVVVTMGRAGREHGYTVFGPGTVNGLPGKFVIEIDKRREGKGLIEPMTAACAAVRYGTQKATGMVTLSRGKAGQEGMAAMKAFVNSLETGFADQIADCGWRAVQKVERAASQKPVKFEILVNGVKLKLPLSALVQTEEGAEFSVEVNAESLAAAIAEQAERDGVETQEREAKQAGIDVADQGVGVLTAVA